MLMFSRVATVMGSPRKTMPWATRITEYVNANSGLEVSLWAAEYGYPQGTMGWSTMVDSRPAFREAAGTLLEDDGYLDLLEEGTEFQGGPAQDTLRRMLVGQPPAEPPAVGTGSWVTSAVPSPGHLSEALAWGGEIAEHVAHVTGVPVAFLQDIYGDFGRVTWIALVGDDAGADAVDTALMGDATYLDRVDKAGQLFVPGSGRQGFLTRIA